MLGLFDDWTSSFWYRHGAFAVVRFNRPWHMNRFCAPQRQAPAAAQANEPCNLGGAEANVTADSAHHNSQLDDISIAERRKAGRNGRMGVPYTCITKRFVVGTAQKRKRRCKLRPATQTTADAGKALNGALA